MACSPSKAFLCVIFIACNQQSPSGAVSAQQQVTEPQKVHYQNIGQIPPPGGFTRTKDDQGSFARWLRSVPLNSDNTVYLFDGRKKTNQLAQFAVLDISVGDRDLQQCADAVMRLRAEYLFSKNDFDNIHFTDNEGTKYQFSAPFTRVRFDQYLQRVFGMCGSASLSKELKNIQVKDIRAGDVFIRGGFPGHAVIVVDVATNVSGKKVYLLAQSYMPAQNIHILKNPQNEELSPWYEANEDENIYTPEYNFKKNELKTWKE